jgi:DNA-binding winged helix-turn-helix (wHTH) protein
VRSRSLDQYIVKIREAFGRHTLDLAAFRTIHGVGYIYDQNPPEGATPAVAASAAKSATPSPLPPASGKK